ncbi:MAG: vitamin K epoxide reductase family protein [Acidilobaceae archaeon]
MELVIGGPLGMALVVALLLVGLGASLVSYLEFRYGIGTPLCRPGTKVDCYRVYSMPQAWLLGYHLSQLAPLYFTMLLSLSLAWVLTGNGLALKTLSFVALESAFLALYLIYLMVKEAKALCLYCLAMHSSIVLVAVLTHRVFLYAGM